METKRYELTARPTTEGFESRKINSSRDSYEYVKKFWHEDIVIYESFFLLMLNQANETIAYAKISQGGVAGTVVDPKIIAKYAVDCLAQGVIVAHNHPSGKLIPSGADDFMTKKVQDGLRLLDITLLDHLIITSASYFSYADNGKI